MKRILFLNGTLVLLCCSFCIGQTVQQKRFGYDLLNQYYTENKRVLIVSDLICNDQAKTKLKEYLTQEFLNSAMSTEKRENGFILEQNVCENDLAFMRSQLDRITICTLDSTAFKKSIRKRLIAEADIKLLKTALERNSSRNYLFFPLFNEDRTVVMLFLSKFCGFECHTEGLYFFKLAKNQWQFAFSALVALE
jgi:hypothetical protein